MAKQHKSTKRGAIQDGTLALRAANGTPMIAFPAAAAENYRRMITNLTHQDGLPRRVSIVASLPKEGVTFTTLALATTVAYASTKRVCAVELNWLSPGLQDQLLSAEGKKKANKQRSRRQEGTGNADDQAIRSPGLAAVLQRSVTLDEALIQTELPNLALIPAGNLSLVQIPFMARSEALQACIEVLSQRFDHLILDIPAIQATSDAIALASLGDACCMVVQQGATSLPRVRISLDEIKHLKILGIVLNKVAISMPKFLYDFIPQD